MTILTAKNTPRVSYTATASQTAFTIPFEFFSTNDIKVYNGTSLLTYNASPSSTSQYKISGTASASDSAYEFGAGGIVTLGGSGASAGNIITIIRDISIERTSDFPTTGSFDITSLNTDLDKIYAKLADIDQQSDRSVKLLDTDSISATVTLPAKASRASKVMTFTSDGNVETTINSVDVTTIAGISSDVTTVSGIASNVTSVASNSSNINTVAGAISNVNTVGGISSDVTTVAGISSNVTTVAGKASLITSDFAADMSLVTSDFVTDMSLVTADFVSDVNTLATTDIVNDLNLLATSDFVSDLNQLATSDFVSDLNALEAIKTNVTSVADNESNINAAVSNASNINSAVSNASNINSVAGNSTNINAVAGNETNINAVNSNASNINTVAGANSNITTVAGSISNVNTVATNLSGVNDFADRYRVVSSDPSSDNDTGDLIYNTTSNSLKVYEGSSFTTINTSGGISNLIEDTTPQLGGHLDANSKNITNLGTVNTHTIPGGTGTFALTSDLTFTASSTHTLTNKTFDANGTGNSLSNVEVADLASGVLDTDISSVSSSDDTLASAKAIKTYVDAQVTAQDLDFQADSGGALAIDLDSESLTFTGGTGIDTSGSGNAVTFAIDSTVVTTTGSQTLTNKSGNISMFTNDSGYITGVTAGSGIDVSGTTISVETDLRDGIEYIGLDGGDYIRFNNNSSQSFFVNGNEEARLEADGDFHADGDVIAYSTTVSDVALKTDIQMIPNALDKIDEVRGVTFTRHNGQKSAGIIAQELEKVLPEAVREKTLALVDGKTYKTVEYDAIHGLLINCIKELKEQIKELKDGFTK